MVLRGLLECLTCSANITVRVSVGHNPYQKHDFLCPDCEEPIGLGGVKVDLANASSEFDYYENCEEGSAEGTIINLNPHFVIPEDEASQDLIFSWMFLLEHIKTYSEVMPKAVHKEAENPLFAKDVYHSLGGLTHITEHWKLIKKGWSLKNNNKNTLSNRYFNKYKPPSFKGRKVFKSVISDFSYRLILPKMYVYLDQAKKSLENAKNINSSELERLASYYFSELHDEHFKRYFETYSEFFNNYSEYDQSILYTKNLAPVPEGCIATSHGFSHTNMFYGNAYENYTTNISVLALINNIIDGRDFDKFKRMDLQKYLTIDKANRGNPFSENPLLNDFLLCTDSSLRNASHHKSMELIDKGRNVKYRSGGTGAIKTISYSEYLQKCNSIALFSAVLLLVEFELLKYYKP